MKGNGLATKEAGAALGSMLKTNTSLKSLDISGNGYSGCDGPGFSSEVSAGLQDNGALSKMTWSGNERYYDTVTKQMEDPSAVTLDTTMTKADFSNKGLGVSGAMILAAFISGAMSILDVSSNNIGPEGAKALAPAM